MNIEDVKKFEPFFGKWVIEQKLGEGSYGAVYKIKRIDYNGKQYFSALKVISIPKDENELAEAEISCGTQQNTRLYFEEQLQKFETEIELMNQFKGRTNIVSYEDHEIMPRTGEGEIGFDVFVRMELLEDLRNIQRMKPDLLNNQVEIIHIGKDICTALDICQSHNIIHRDIKPGNIMRSADGDYKLGDFGVARSLESRQSMTRIGTLSYMAPEVENGKAYDTRADIYSLGMVLYELLNGNRGPFLPAGPQKITASDKEKARERILRGQEIPYPSLADERLGAVVQKACAFLPQERYQSAKEFYMALELAERQLLGFVKQEALGNVQDSPAVLKEPMETVQDPPSTVGQNRKKRSRAGIFIGVFLAVFLASAGLLFVSAAVRGRWGFIRDAESSNPDDDETEDKKTAEENDPGKDLDEEDELEDTDIERDEKASLAAEGQGEKKETPLEADSQETTEEPIFRKDTEDDVNPFAEKKEPAMSLNTDIHRYEIYLEDVTWEQAFEKSKANGGYLAHIDSQEELEYVSGVIDEFEASSGIDVVHFWLGGKCYNIGGENAYYWADTDGNSTGVRLDGIQSPYYSFWLEGEPSFGEEEYIDMFIMDGRYVWNDAPNDVIEALYGQPSGKVAYIVEYED